MDTLVIAYGSTARSAKRAVLNAREEGYKPGLLTLKTIWPFAEEEIIEVSKKVKKIIIPEMNLGQIAHEVEWATKREKPIIKINRINGEPIAPKDIYSAIIK